MGKRRRCSRPLLRRPMRGAAPEPAEVADEGTPAGREGREAACLPAPRHSPAAPAAQSPPLRETISQRTRPPHPRSPSVRADAGRDRLSRRTRGQQAAALTAGRGGVGGGARRRWRSPRDGCCGAGSHSRLTRHPGAALLPDPTAGSLGWEGAPMRQPQAPACRPNKSQPPEAGRGAATFSTRTCRAHKAPGKAPTLPPSGALRPPLIPEFSPGRTEWRSVLSQLNSGEGLRCEPSRTKPTPSWVRGERNALTPSRRPAPALPAPPAPRRDTPRLGVHAGSRGSCPRSLSRPHCPQRDLRAGLSGKRETGARVQNLAADRRG